MLPQKPRGRKPRCKQDPAQPVRETSQIAQPFNPGTQGYLPDHVLTKKPISSPSGTSNDLNPAIAHLSFTSLTVHKTSTSTPTETSRRQQMRLTAFPAVTFAPYLELFSDRLYPIFPVLEVDKLRDLVSGSSNQDAGWQLSPKIYALLTSLSAAVILQLNLHNQKCLDDAFETLDHQTGRLSSSDRTNLTFISAENFIAHCLHARQQWDFMADPDEESLMTSFFLFEYYGNKNQSSKAWFYLREAIGLGIALDIEESLPTVDSQRKSRIFWLLYITERAYALQHRSSVILRPSIPLPRVFDSKEPKLVYGFVSLVNVYRCVDTDFLSAWKAKPTLSISNDESQSHFREPNSTNEVGYFESIDFATTATEISEIQYLDISVTQKWLPLLQWQLKNGRRLTSTTVAHPISTSTQPPSFHPRFPFKVSQELLAVISRASRRSLESHGIGMEQKIFDVACCLSDVLESTPLSREASVTGHTFLHGFMTLLASFRNQESQYLRPLLERAAKTLAAELQTPRLLTAPEESKENTSEDWIRHGMRTGWGNMQQAV